MQLQYKQVPCRNLLQCINQRIIAISGFQPTSIQKAHEQH
ncbi:hypothetical protein PT7_1380 [Pusillimonas sp. T7-7]|nr:hypothetical protein PT7_1380 [Pusillimonas sp. T7-7]